MKFLFGILIALNQLTNAVTGGLPDESVSSRVGRSRDRGGKVAAGVCHFLDWTDPRDGDGPKGDHCDAAIAKHIQRQEERMERMKLEGARP